MTRRALRGPPSLRQPCMPPEQLPFPTEAQLDLLKAALLPADQAAPAWRRWKARGLRLDSVDEASGRLFSQLWVNRDAAGVGDEDLTLLKGVYRQALANNAVVIAAALEAVQLLIDEGIPVLFFKGAAMIAIAGGRLGLRRIVDVDVLIPEADAERAMAILTAAGYQPKPDQPPVVLGLYPAWGYRGQNGPELDLHWWAFKVAGDDSVMFETAREATLVGHSVLIPSATECLVSAVGNAFSGRPPGSPLRWIADAMLLFELEGDAIDWRALVERARRPGLTLGLSRGLEFLAGEFGAPVPADVLAELRRRHTTMRERAAYWATVNDPRVGMALIDQLERHRTRRLHYPTSVPRDFLGHLAQATGAMTGKRRDLFERYAIGLLRRIAKGDSLLREG
jgi:hypothetical protein